MICERCEREIVGNSHCRPGCPVIFPDGSSELAVLCDLPADEHCGDCGVVGGSVSVHHAHCDMERCPRCGGQLLVCEVCGCDRTALEVH